MENLNSIYYRYVSFYGRFNAFEFYKIKSITDNGTFVYDVISFYYYPGMNEECGDIEYEKVKRENLISKINKDIFRYDLGENYSWKSLEDIFNLENPRLSYLIIKKKFLANEYVRVFY
jgi:hypothetical protein